jgi:hypothetical protein
MDRGVEVDPDHSRAAANAARKDITSRRAERRKEPRRLHRSSPRLCRRRTAGPWRCSGSRASRSCCRCRACCAESVIGATRHDAAGRFAGTRKAATSGSRRKDRVVRRRWRKAAAQRGRYGRRGRRSEADARSHGACNRPVQRPRVRLLAQSCSASMMVAAARQGSSRRADERGVSLRLRRLSAHSAEF